MAALGASPFLINPAELLKILPEEKEDDLATEMIRLSANENPYSPSPAMRKTLDSIGPELCRYPNAQFSDLEELIAQKEGIPKDCVVVTSGSREGLNAAGLLYGMNGGEILTCMPTYRALVSYAEKFGAQINIVPLDEDLKFDLDELDRRINRETQLVFVCNPNNPTGTILDNGSLESFCKQASAKTTVFVDEAYFDYIEHNGYPSMAGLIKDGYDLIVSRTFSKVYGLAGVRVGFLMAREDTASRLRSHLMSGTNIVAIRLAMAALNDKKFRYHCLAKNREAKEMIYTTLNNIGLKYIRSHANFVFFHTGRNINEVISDFRTRGIQVGRPFPPLTDWCRISTGKIEDVAKFTSALNKVFA
jgi:histidinol-phosphate aminotransferase